MQKVREQIEALKAIWTETKPEYHGELVEFGQNLGLILERSRFSANS